MSRTFLPSWPRSSPRYASAAARWASSTDRPAVPSRLCRTVSARHSSSGYKRGGYAQAVAAVIAEDPELADE